MCDSSEAFVRLGDSLTRNRRSGSDDGGSIPGEVETGPSDSDLLRILECPVCTEFPGIPIYNCKQGHFTCNDCIALLNECTLCQSPFTQVRNYALESIIERTRFKCKYANQGCPETLGGTGGEFKRHLDTCRFGPLLCNEKMSTVCEKYPVEPENYLEHLFSSHDASGKYIKDNDLFSGDFVQKKGDVFPPIYLKSETSQLTFILNTKKYKSFICWWITCLDLQEIGNYQARLTWSKKVESSTDTDQPTDCFLQWILPVHSMKRPFDEIRDSGLCSVVPETHLNPFLMHSEESEEANWNIRVEVMKKGELEIGQSDQMGLNEFLRSYFPLITTIFMIFALALMYGIFMSKGSDMQPNENERVISGSGQGSADDYYGYRGFYYHSDVEPTDRKTGRKREKVDNRRKLEKDSEEYYVGYGGFYYKNDKENNRDSENKPHSEGIISKMIRKLLGLKHGKSYINGKSTNWLDFLDLMTRFSAVFMTIVLILTSFYYCNFSRWTV